MNEFQALPRIAAGVMRWGEWGANLSTDQLHELVLGCLDAGISCFDHADIYGHYTEEAAFGRVLAKAPALRQQMTIVTKCGINLVTPNRPNIKLKSYDSSKEHILASVDLSLKALQTDYIDVLLIHRPDVLMNADEIAEAFSILEEEGKVRAFGVSNFTVGQFELLKHRWPKLMTNQIELSLKHVDPLTDGTLDQAQLHRCAPMIWSPLGGGDLFSSNSSIPRLSAKLASLAEAKSCTPDVIAYAWVLKHPTNPTLVTGSTKLSRIVKAKEALSLNLTREEWYDLYEAARGHEVA